MPHAILRHSASGTISATTRSDRPRQLIPGIEPGGSRVGQPTKPALLIMEAWIEVFDAALAQAVNDYHGMTGYLILSQEQSLNPGFLIPVAQIGGFFWEQTAVGRGFQELAPKRLFREQGTVWAPKFVGTYWREAGVASIEAVIHLEYEVVRIPWVEWFVKWDFLDHIGDLRGEH